MAINIKSMQATISRTLKNQLGLFFLLLMINNAMAQPGEKKIYHAELDSLWSKGLSVNYLTSNGKWVIFTEIFENRGRDTRVKHTEKDIEFLFAKGERIELSKDNRWFGCITPDKQLQVVDLENSTKSSYPDMQSYSFAGSGDFLAGFQKTESAEVFCIIELKTKAITRIEGVKKFSWQPNKKSLLLTLNFEGQNKLVVYDVENKAQKVIKESQQSEFMHCQWSESGNAILFLEQADSGNKLHYQLLNGEIATLDEVMIQEKFSGYKLANRSVYISKDGKRVFFYRQLPKVVVNESMQVWTSEEPWIYPRFKEYSDIELQYMMTVWMPESGKLTAIETGATPTSAFNIDHDYALVFNKLTYEPLYKEFPNADVYVKNITTAEQQLVVKNHYTGVGFVSISPSGNYITYFKDKNWWLFDNKKKQTINLTKDINATFENIEHERAGDILPYGNPGWSADEQFIFIYDQFDIWQITPDGKIKNRITNGREQNIQYRISENHSNIDYSKIILNKGYATTAYTLKKGLLLEMYEPGLHKSGYAHWGHSKKLKQLVFEAGKINRALITQDNKHMVYVKQKFNEPFSVYYFKPDKDRQRLVYQSNKKILDYDLGSAEIINYKVGDKDVVGSLFYPANFDPKKKYPMIVYIYEKASNVINSFEPPTDFDSVGFSMLKYTTHGYFVLYPDITYTIGEPGISALNSVEAAVNKALERGYINENKLGLIGHSFGGYESAFIATQTNRFAAVVAGAAVTNLTSHYHSVGWYTYRPEIWRYESQQWRMGDSYYNIKEAYLRNSPMHQIEQIHTPILLWTGKEDYQVNWTQSIEMFLALKRLGKKCNLLLFEKEPHILLNTENQKRLSHEIKSWFDNYLK
jgi:dipeptidyl aminopeptidase/acylaminoacyl peptidase